MQNTTVLVTAEHGGNRLPLEYKSLFNRSLSVLETHRGLDIGTWNLADNIARKIPNNQLFRTDITRLLVDVNRSLWRRTLFSEVTKTLSRTEKKNILDKYYYAYRYPIYDYVKQEIKKNKKVIHIAVHSFTPVLNGKTRQTDIGLLYNPERKNEVSFCRILKKEMAKDRSEWRVRFNYPYRGKPDGLTAHFRKNYPDKNYLGIEFEVNQKYALEKGQFPAKVQNDLCNVLLETIKIFNWI